MSKFPINEHGYWETTDGTGHGTDKELAVALCRFLHTNHAKNVADFGCGMGEYARKIIDAGIDCLAIDGNPNTHLLTGGLGYVLDLSEPQELVIAFDFVMSLEVGEHIPPQYEQVFLDNLTNHARRGIILSWAVPGQGGDGHFNEQDNAYIIVAMGKRGWEYQPKASQYLREAATFPWFKNTIMVFRRLKHD